MGLATAWFDWAVHLTVSPARVYELVLEAQRAALKLGSLSWTMMQGHGECVPCEHSLPHDKRFRSVAWQQWPFALYAETLLATERWWDEATSHVHGAAPHDLAKLNFVARQALDCFSPSNFVLTNPDVLNRTRASHGTNLLQGLAHAADDMMKVMHGRRPAGADAFQPGKNVAITKGEVVLRTPLVEVIQYTPATEQVRPEPIVIVPAWIMKYYILDLQSENSLVKYLVDHGYTVFMISWKNPDARLRDIGFDDYRAEGIARALHAALTITGAPHAHLVGYCIGGTLSAIAAAAMAQNHDDRLQSLTLLAAQTDFTEAGELRLFIDESQLAVLDDIMWEKGVLAASKMVGTFNLLRSNDLIWSRLIHHYLLAESEATSDIAAWSLDATRMPFRMHSEYLRGLYLNNDLAEGRMMVDGKPIALQDIRIPLFVVGAEWDHVAPWTSVYKAHSLFETDITFALTNGGHNQGIVSPPTHTNRHYHILTTPARDLRTDPATWLKSAPLNDGSWWPAWIKWLESRSGSPVAPPNIGDPSHGLPVIAPAPGCYVFE